MERKKIPDDQRWKKNVFHYISYYALISCDEPSLCQVNNIDFRLKLAIAAAFIREVNESCRAETCFAKSQRELEALTYFRKYPISFFFRFKFVFFVVSI